MLQGRLEEENHYLSKNKISDSFLKQKVYY